MITTINEKTSVPLKILIPIFIFIIPLIWLLSAKLTEIEQSQKRAEIKIENIEKRIDIILAFKNVNLGTLK